MKTKITIAILISVLKLTAQNNNIFNGGGGDGWAKISVGTGGEVPLPVEFLSFTANLKNNSVELNWSTAVEMNNNYFMVQRSRDGVNFEDIAIVSGSGNSNVIRHYSSVDLEPYNGTSFYRLKQVDFNGTFFLTKMASVSLGSTLDIVVIQKEETTINIKGAIANERILLNIITSEGKIVFSKIIVADDNGFCFASFPDTFADGIYILTAHTTENSYVKKLIK